MGYVTIALLILAGLLGASGLIVAKKPNAKESLDKLAPYQGWIGVISAIWGVWWIISWVLNLDLLRVAPISMISQLVAAVVLLGLGILLGIGLMKTFVKDAKAQAKLDESYARLAPKQGMLGIIALCVGVWVLLNTLILHIA